jgi:hypothetical protein
VTDLVRRLEQLLVSLSNGEWEHDMGITIENLDNPGWLIRISLNGTEFQDISVDPRIVERSEHDWLQVKTEIDDHDKFLTSACGPQNLREALEVMFAILDRKA